MRASTCVLPASRHTSPHRRPIGGRARCARVARRVVVAASASSRNDAGDKKPLHVHVGAGKLAMGLVIPSLLESEVPTVVLQTTRAPWNDVRASAARQTRSFDESRLHTSVRHRNRPVPSARLIFDDASAVAFVREAQDGANASASNTFIISDDIEAVWNPLIRAATSVSTSVGPALVDWLGKDVLLRALPRRADAGAELLPKVYCCENDHDAVRVLAATLRDRATTIPVVVDKVCSSLRVDGPEDEDPEEGDSVRKGASRRWTAFVATEPFPGMILPLSGCDAHDPALPFDARNNHGEVFRYTRDDRAAAFLHAKKLSQVNGVHTCLAFCALLAAPVRDFDGKYAVRSLHDVRLQSLETLSSSLADSAWTWAVAETLAVVAAHDADVVAEATARRVGEEAGTGADDASSRASPEGARRFEDARHTYAARRVLRDARESLARLSGSAPEDSVGRVLNAGITLRLEGRMRTTRDAIRALKRKFATDVASHGTRNGDNARRALGPIAAAVVRESGFESVEALSRATDAAYADAAAVAAFVTAGAEENEKRARNNAVTRPAWAEATAETTAETTNEPETRGATTRRGGE